MIKNITVSIFFACCCLQLSAQSWDIANDDTKLIVSKDGKGTCNIVYLGNVTGTWNWATNAIPLKFVDKISINGSTVSLNWKLVSADRSAAKNQLALEFKSSEEALELKVVFEAKSGPGPIRYSMFLKNVSGKVVTIYNPESFDLSFSLPAKARLTYINDDASIPDSIGVYHHSLVNQFSKSLIVSESHDWIPFLVIDGNNAHGIYSGWEWSHGRMKIQSSNRVANVQIGVGDEFKTDVAPGEVFAVPPGFIGAYKGDLDDCGNHLRKYLYRYNMPDRIIRDSTFPKTEWNAFAAAGKEQGSWDPVEKKYYALIDDIAPLGFEEVVIDIGWWSDYGDPGHIITDSIDWPSGMVAAARYTKQKGMRFGLYDNEPEDLNTKAGISERIRDVKYLINNLEADFYRSDATAGPVTKGSFGKDHRAKYKEDVAYWATWGFYNVIDSLYKIIPGFLWENCASGGGLKDYGAVRRSGRIQNQDVYYPIEARRSFFDASHAFHTMHLACVVGSWKPWQAEGSVYEFRSASMGAAYWHPDAPNGGNGGPVWSAKQKSDITKAVATYKNKLRPLIRYGNLYHVFPRPDNIRWDGVEYYDPEKRKGVVYVFKPEKSTTHRQVIKLKGLEAKSKYRVVFEDGTNRNIMATGAQLMNKGFEMQLMGTLVSELVFIDDVNEY